MLISWKPEYLGENHPIWWGSEKGSQSHRTAGSAIQLGESMGSWVVRRDQYWARIVPVNMQPNV